MVLVPIAVFAGLLALANRRARAIQRGREQRAATNDVTAATDATGEVDDR